MTFDEVLDQAIEMLRRRGRLTYRTLKRQFALDDEALDDLKEELLYSHPEVVDDAGRGLIWNGAADSASAPNRTPAPASPPVQFQSPTPVSYTPPHLAERILAEQAAMEARGSANGERKTITALFADLKGSTALIEGLDPEEARTVIDPALQLMMDAVHQYDGFVAQALGDGIFALFGAPLAHEDHPQRAVYAALRMQEAMRRYGDTLRAKGYPPLLLRVGLNTGEVVLRSIRKDDLHADYVPVGHSTNLAARMEQLATPGSIVVSAYTHRLTDGYFAFKDLGPTQIKGVEEPLHIYEVFGVGQLRTRLQVSASRYGLTRFVGRQSEMEQLNRALAQATAGQGQIVGAMGEPGLGKSRLFHEFKLLSLGGCLVLEAYAVSYGKATAYLPVIELLKSYFHIESQDDERTRREKVGGKVLMLDRSLEDTLPYLFALLGVEEQPSPLVQMDPQIRRRRTFEALKKLFLRESLNQPLILIFEDLHWIDGETQGFLDVLSESVASTKILLLTNYRPEYRHEWGQKTYYTQLRLAPLGQAEAEELLTFLLGTDASLPAVKALILEKTQGTPFFMEEMVQTLVEDGALVGERGHYRLGQTLTELHISPTVQGVLAARIDRLAPDEKALVQQLAVIGRQFPLSLIRQVIVQPEADLYRLLASLQHKEFLYEQPAFPESEYIFKHALTQEVAYGTVLQEQRKTLHERTGQALETVYAATLPEHYSDLAHHYGRSPNTEKAITYLQLAGQQAVQRSAYGEALHYLSQGLEHLTHLPPSPERVQQEQALQTTRGAMLIATQGHTAPEVEETYRRVLSLSQKSGDLETRFQALLGLFVHAGMRGKLQQSLEFAHQLLTLAEQTANPQLSAIAHLVLGESLYWQGRLREAQEQLERALACDDLSLRRPVWTWFDMETNAHGHLALVLWLLGYPERAQQQVHEAFRVAQERAHPWRLAMTLMLSCFVADFRQEWDVLRERVEALRGLCQEYGLGAFLPLAEAMQGRALTQTGQVAEGLTQIRSGIAAYQAAEGEFGLPYLLLQVGEAYGKLDDCEHGLTVATDALAMAEKNGDRWYEAELYRLKGELTLEAGGWRREIGSSSPQSPNLKPPVSSGAEREAEECFRKAIEIARQQQAKSWELRAATSLARLWQSQGKTADARQMLAEIYSWFTEGFDTKDLKDAKALLEELT